MNLSRTLFPNAYYLELAKGLESEGVFHSAMAIKELVANNSNLKTQLDAASDRESGMQVAIGAMEDMVNEARQAESDSDKELLRLKSFLRRYRYLMSGGDVMQKYIDKVFGDPSIEETFAAALDGPNTRHPTRI